MKAFIRAQQITKQVAYAQTKRFTQSPSNMQLDINCTLRMKSGFEIPVLGYGGYISQLYLDRLLGHSAGLTSLHDGTLAD
jgi:hypothetical protein